jgi:hypothetical protein
MSEEIKGTPDISRIISVIMENPELIEQISALAAERKDEAPPVIEKAESVSASESVREVPLHSRREQLLTALKPYLSEERQRVIDSMMTFGEILEAIKRR